MKTWWRILCVGAALLTTVRVGAYQDYPQAVGDLVYRDSDHQIYGRDGVSSSMAIHHPGHVGVYVGGGQVAEALATTDWLGVPTAGDVMLSPLHASAGVHSFYEDWSDAGTYDGVEDHGHMGAKTHESLVSDLNALTLRQNIVMLALNQVGEGYDNDFSNQKGPGADQWTCVGFAEAVYEYCVGQTLPASYPSYGDQSQYAGGLNITPDGYDYHFIDVVCYYQKNVEFSQIPTTFLVGRPFGLTYYVFFPYTQFEQGTLVDSFAQSAPPTPPVPVISSLSPTVLQPLVSPNSQTLRIFGSGFTSSSTLVFRHGVSVFYSVPARRTFVSGNELDYEIIVAAADGAWTAQVVNGSQQSGQAAFTVAAPPPPSTGSLTVTLQPVGAVSAGAQWQVGGGSYHNSGDTVAGLTPGTYTVSCKAVTGYSAPSSHSVTITGGTVTSDTETYNVVAPSTYTLTLNYNSAQGGASPSPLASSLSDLGESIFQQD